MWLVFSSTPDPNILSPDPTSSRHLLLSSSLRIGLLSLPLRPLSGLPVVAPGSPELPVLGLGVLLRSGDLALSDGIGIWSNGESRGNDSLGSGSEVLGAGVTLLWFAELAGEEDEFRAVGLEALDVGSEGWNGVVDTAVVDRDTDCAGESRGDLSSLQLLQGETPTGTDTAVVLDGWASDDWPQLVDWAGGNGSSLGDSGIPPAEFTARLVEVSADASLPLLSEVVVWDLLIVLDSHCVEVGGWSSRGWVRRTS